MKKILKNTRYIYLAIGLAIVIFLANCGLNPFTIEMPKSFVDANERAVFILHGSTESVINNNDPAPWYTTQLLVGVMVPKNWNARQNAIVSFTSPKGNETMRMIPDSEIEAASGLNWPAAAKRRFGIGPNLVDDFEWIVYRSVKAYTFVNGENINIDVNVDCKVGAENMLVKLGFFMGSSRENLRPEDTQYTQFAFSNIFEVKNGEGDLIDFVNPQFSKIEPVKSLDNDIITLVFNAGVDNTILDNVNDIYLCAKGYNASGQMIAEVCEQTAKTKLTPIGGKRFRLDLWPRGFFNLPSGTSLSYIEYFYTDVTGVNRVGYGNTADAFRYTFKCQ